MATSSRSRRGDLYDDPVTAWAKDIESGRIISGELMMAGAERHLKDMRDGPARGLHWSKEKAAHALGFFPACLRVTAGAKEGEPFNLPNYTAFVVGSLFGWVRSSGLLRFKSGWVETGKGQIKSPMLAAVGLYKMGFLGIPRSEVYAIAKDRNQANVLFKDAVAMCRAPMPDDIESLEDKGTVIIRGEGDNAWKIEHPDSSSSFSSVAGDEAPSGPRPSAVLADEIHEWKSARPLEIWKRSLAKMPGDSLLLMGTNTPAADQLVGTELAEHHEKIVRGELHNDATFVLIARVDVKDDPLTDERCWKKALPLLGITYTEENIRDEVIEANQRISAKLTVQRLFFGIKVGTSEYWIDIEAWEGALGKVDAEEMKGYPCWLSLDLSQKNDLTALGMGWRKQNRLYARVEYWKPRDGDAGIDRAGQVDGAPYREWEKAKLLHAVPGKVIDYDFVAVTVQRICAEQMVQFLAFDPAHVTEFIKACDRIGFKVWIWNPKEPPGEGLMLVIHGQGKMGMTSERTLWMPRSLQKFEDHVLKQTITVENSQVTRWCAGNAAVEVDSQKNRHLVKRRSRGRIDGLVALAMLVGAAESGITTATGGSYLDEAEEILLLD